MKKLFLLTVTTLLSVIGIQAQNDQDHGHIFKGQWQVEINTGANTTGATGFALVSSSTNTAWALGAEGSYFVADDLGIKLGLGYSDNNGISGGTFNYKIGAKYYITHNIPLGIDFTGATNDNFNASWIGVQGGYAIFVTDQLSIEPTLRYNITTDDQKADSLFQALIGFAYHF